MKNILWITVSAALGAMVLAPLACGGGGGGTGGSGGSGGTNPASNSSSHSSGSPTSTASTGGNTDCTGVLAGIVSDECNTCLENSCCAEVTACSNAGNCPDCVTDDSQCDGDAIGPQGDVIACAQGSCNAECFMQQPTFDATCNPPTGQTGACVTIGGAIECNPVTGEPCNTAAGEACDVNQGGYECYPDGNVHAICEGCGSNGDYCMSGLTCAGGTCGRYCCDDADCTPGTCDKSGGYPGGVGVCLGGNTDGGAPDAGTGGAGTGGADGG